MESFFCFLCKKYGFHQTPQIWPQLYVHVKVLDKCEIRLGDTRDFFFYCTLHVLSVLQTVYFVYACLLYLVDF